MVHWWLWATDIDSETAVDDGQTVVYRCYLTNECVDMKVDITLDRSELEHSSRAVMPANVVERHAST
jgi:hypothetical protein